MKKQHNYNKENYYKFTTAIKEYQETMATKPSCKSSIIVLGNTGSGKSTLINYLLDKELVGKKYNIFEGDYILNCINPLTKMSETLISETTVPVYTKDGKRNLVYWDCPGFNDTRGDMANVLNAYCIGKIAKKTNFTKILIVITESDFKSGRGEVVRDIIRMVSAMYSNKENLKNVFICFNQMEKKINANMAISSILESSSNFSISEKNILKNIINNGNVCSIPKANKEGLFPSEYKDTLINGLTNLTEVSSNYIKPVIIQKHLKFAYKMLNGLDDDITNRLLNIVESVKTQIPLAKTEDLLNYVNKISNYKKSLSQDGMSAKSVIKMFDQNIINPLKSNSNEELVETELNEIYFLIEELFLVILNPLIGRNYLEPNTMLSPYLRISKHVSMELYSRGALTKDVANLIAPQLSKFL